MLWINTENISNKSNSASYGVIFSDKSNLSEPNTWANTKSIQVKKDSRLDLGNLVIFGSLQNNSTCSPLTTPMIAITIYRLTNLQCLHIAQTSPMSFWYISKAFSSKCPLTHLQTPYMKRQAYINSWFPPTHTQTILTLDPHIKTKHPLTDSQPQPTCWVYTTSLSKPPSNISTAINLRSSSSQQVLRVISLYPPTPFLHRISNHSKSPF